MNEVSKFIRKNGTVFILKDANARVQIQSILDIIAPLYDNTYEYSMGDFTIHNHKMYYCIADTTGEFDSSKWKAVSLASRIENIEDGAEDTTYTLIQSPEDPNTLIFTPSRGADPTIITIPKTVYEDATQSASGLLSATDKSKLDGIDISADVNKIEFIKINNIDQPIVDKVVNITVPVTTSDLINDSSYYSSTEVSNAITNAIDDLDVEAVGGVGKYIQSISETNGKINATSADLPIVNNGTLTIQKNGTNVQTFSANQSSNVIADIIVPTKLSDLENDTDFGNYSSLNNAPILGTAASKNATNIVISDSEDLVTSGAVKSAINASLSSYYRPSGDKTVSQLIDSLLVAANIGCVYNITDSGITTSSFTNGANKPIRVGDNVAIVNIGTVESPIYKFDLLAGFVDLSGYSEKNHKHIISDITDFPTSMPASDVSAWAKASTKPTYTASEVGAATSAQGSKADTAVQIIKIGGTAQTKTDGVVNLPAYPTTLPASDVSSWAKAATKPTYTASEIGLGNVGNFKAVSTVANQGLTDVEKANARANIGAGTSNFSGSYNDLSNKPTIPIVNNGTLTIQKNGTNVGTFTANQSTAATINITVPTTASDIGAANTSHGNHVPAIQSADNSKFLRNDNTWQKVTPANIGAATANHNHDSAYVAISNFSKIYTSTPSNPTAGTMWVTTS